MAKLKVWKIEPPKREPSYPLIRYAVKWNLTEREVFLEANDIEESDTTLVFRIIYDPKEGFAADDVEIVAMFHEWVYFVAKPMNFDEKLDSLVRIAKPGVLPKNFG
jgi:hypothetical protein